MSLRDWLCCRRSLVCLLDNFLHGHRIHLRFLCDAHDRVITGE